MRPSGLRIIVCLALGIMTTVGIAWTLALLPLNPHTVRLSLRIDPDDPSYSANHMVFCQASARGRARYEWAPLFPIDAHTDLSALLARCQAAADGIDRGPPDLQPSSAAEDFARPHAWPSLASLPIHRNIAVGQSTDIRGLPFPALASFAPIFVGLRTGLGPPVSWGVAIHHPTGDMQDPWTAFPLRPVFPGFGFDTLIWSLLWLAAIAVLAAARSHLRRRRGLCPACGYDLTGNTTGVCPECGQGKPV